MITQNFTFGIDAVDGALNGGLARGRLHEIYASGAENGARDGAEHGAPSVAKDPDQDRTADAASACGFAAMLAIRACLAGDAIFWLRHERAARLGGVLQAQGLIALGLDPAKIICVMAPDTDALLRAAVDAVRCGGLGAVVVEGWGAMPRLDLTASRRLKLAAETSGVTLLLLRIDAVPVTSAAETRWSVKAAPSSALAANAPGRPAFDIALLRRRAGPAGLATRLEWNRDQLSFQSPWDGTLSPAQPAHAPEALPRFVVSSSGDRQGTERAAA